jgi:hypothetical protein
MIFAIHTWTIIPDGGDPKERRMYLYDNITNMFITHDMKLVCDNLLPSPGDLNIDFTKIKSPFPPHIVDNSFQPACDWCPMAKTCKYSHYYNEGKYPDMETCDKAYFNENLEKFRLAIEKHLEKYGLTPFMIEPWNNKDYPKFPEARRDILELKFKENNRGAWTPPHPDVVEIMPEALEEYNKPFERTLLLKKIE